MLYGYYFPTEFGDLPDDVFVSAFDVFDIGDEGVPTSDHSCEDHCYSCTEIPARHSSSLQVCFSKYHRFMGIHDGDMPLHLLDLDEPVQSPFEENFMDT